MSIPTTTYGTKDTNATDPMTLLRNRFPKVEYRKYTRFIDYDSDAGIRRAPLGALSDLKTICKMAKRAIKDAESGEYPWQVERKIYYYANTQISPNSMKAALLAGIITGEAPVHKHIKGRYVNVDDPNDVIEVEKRIHEHGEYKARTDVDYDAIIEQINSIIKRVI